MLDETLDQPDSSRNRVMAQVAAHLLIAPSLQHLINGLRLRMQQRNRPDDVHAATLVEGKSASYPVSSDASLNHSLNQYHIAAARRVTFRTLRAGVSANRAIPKAPAHVAASQNGHISGLLGRNGASPMADRQSAQ